MANTAVAANRRNEIGARWLKGQSVASIARELGIPLGTVKHDLHYLRQELLAGQGDVLRMIRARSLAVSELVCAEAWRRLDVLTASDEPDEHAIAAYLGVILKGQGQAARLSGLPTKVRFNMAHEVYDRDIETWIDDHNPEKVAERKYWAERFAAARAEADGSDDDEEAGDDGRVSEDELIERVNAAFEMGRETGLREARTVDATPELEPPVAPAPSPPPAPREDPIPPSMVRGAAPAPAARPREDTTGAEEMAEEDVWEVFRRRYSGGG